MISNDHPTLYALGDHGQTIDGSVNDVRGREVKDAHGVAMGKVTDLLIDNQERKVRFLLVEHGGFLGFGEKKSLIPVQAITKITEYDVLIDQTHERVASAPGYTPDLIDDQDHHAHISNHYGYPPYWGLYDMPAKDGMRDR